MEGSGLEKVFETVYGKNTVTHVFSQKASSRAPCYYFLVKTALQMTLMKHLWPEAAFGIDEKAIEDTADKNFSNAKFLTTDAVHTTMTPPFYYCLAFQGVF